MQERGKTHDRRRHVRHDAEVQPNAATTLAREPRESPAASV